MQAKLFTLCLALCAVCFSATSQNVPDYVPTDGLVNWWPLDGSALDFVGSNDGEIDGCSPAQNRFGEASNALMFDGENDRISFDTFFSGQQMSAVSYSIWFNTLESSVQYISGKEGYWRTIYIRLTPANEISFGGTSQNVYFGVTSNEGVIQLGVWHHFVVTFEDAVISLYLDGELIVEGPSATNLLDYQFYAAGNSTATNYLGAIYPVSPGLCHFFNGTIDDFGLWNRALSPCEITELYEADLSGANFNAGTDLEICSGDSVVLTATGGTGGLDWTGGVEDGVAFVPDSTMSYVVTGGVGSCTAADTVTVTVLDPVFSLDVQTACDSLTWLDGITYLESTVVPSLVLQSSAGCDSIVSLDLTVNYTTYSTIDTMAVNVFEYEGVEYTEGGEFTIVLDNAAGCDSVVTLKLDLEYVGVEESLAAESWSLYPNPVTNQLSIDLSKWEGAFSVLLTNALGQVVWEQSVQGIASIDVSAYARGVYTVEVLGLKTRERQTLILR